MSVTYRLLTCLDDVVALRPAWDDLAAATSDWPTHQPFWALAWLRRENAGALRVMSAWEDHELVGLAPLEARRVAGASILRGIGHGAGGLGAVLVRPDSTLSQVDLLEASLRPGPTLLQLLDVPQDQGVAEATSGRSTIARRAADGCPITSLRLLDDEASWWQKRPGQLKKALRRGATIARREQRPITTHLVRQPAELETALPEVLALNRRAEQHEQRGDALCHANVGVTLAGWRAAAAEGRLRLGLCRVDGRLAAYVAAFRVRRLVSAEATRYDPELARFSPGSHAILALFRAAHDEGAEQISLGLGIGAYKAHWCDQVVWTNDLLGWSHRPLRPLAEALGRRARPARSRPADEASQPAPATREATSTEGSGAASPKL